MDDLAAAPTRIRPLLAEIADAADDLVAGTGGDRIAGVDQDDVGFAEQPVQLAFACAVACRQVKPALPWFR